MDSNPISTYWYASLLCIEGFLQIAVPFGISVHIQSLANISQIISDKQTIADDLIFWLAVSTEILIIFLIAFIWIVVHKKMKHVLQKGKESSELRGSLQSIPQKCCFKLLMIIIITYYKVFKFPGLFMYFVNIASFFQSNGQPLLLVDKILRIFSIGFLLLDMLIHFFIEKFLQYPYPSSKIPWAQQEQRVSTLFNFQVYFTALALSFPITNIAIKPLIILCFLYSLMVLVSSIYFMRSYSITIVRTILINSSILTNVFLISILELFWQNNSVHQQESPILEALSLVLSCLFLIFASFFLQDYIYGISLARSKPKSPFQIIDQLSKIITGAQLKRGASDNDICKQELFILSLFDNHKEECLNKDCLCRTKKAIKKFSMLTNSQGTIDSFQQNSSEIIALDNINSETLSFPKLIKSKEEDFKSMLLLLLDILVWNFMNDKNIQKNLKILSYFQIRYKFMIKSKLYSSYYKLLQVHNCEYQNCQFSDCFKAYQLKMAIQQQIKAEESRQRLSNLNLIKNISYEQNFQRFIAETKNCTDNAKLYWQYLNQQESDVKTLLQLGSLLSKSYQNFFQVYEIIQKEIGNTIVVESICFKLHKGVLNFEGETENNLNILRNLDLKEKCLIRNFQNSQDLQLTKIDGNFSLVVLSLNPISFQQVKLVNKQFTLMSGYSEVDLQGKASIFMPQEIDKLHESILKEYIQNKKMVNKGKIQNVYIKHKNSSISPIQIKTHTNITISKELIQIGIITVKPTLEIQIQQIPVNSIFIIITDSQNKILHYSQNCISLLKFPSAISQNDVNISEIIPDLDFTDLTESQSEIMETWLDSSSSYFQFAEIADNIKKLNVFRQDKGRHQIRIKLRRIVHNYFDKLIQNEYRFVIEREQQNLSNQMSFNNNCGASIISNGQNVDGNSIEKESSHQNHDVAQNNVFIFDQDNIEEFTGTQTSASSSTRSNQSIREMKGILNLQSIPRPLSRFKINIWVFFLILLISTIVLLVVNLSYKNSFISDINFYQNIKRLTNRVMKTSLQVLYIYTFANNNYINATSLIDLPLGEPVKFLTSKLSNDITNLQGTIANISQSDQISNSDLSQLYSTNNINLITFSLTGSTYLIKSSLCNSLQQYVVYINSIVQSSKTQMNTSQAIYGRTLDLFKQQKSITDQQQSFLFALYNSQTNIRRNVDSLDLATSGYFSDTSKTEIQVVLIFTIVCSIIVLLGSSVILPFLLKGETDQIHMVEMTINMDSLNKQRMVKRISKFQKYLTGSKYLSGFLDIFNENFDDELDITSDKQASKKQNKNSIQEEEKKDEEHLKNLFKQQQLKSKDQNKINNRQKSITSSQRLKSDRKKQKSNPIKKISQQNYDIVEMDSIRVEDKSQIDNDDDELENDKSDFSLDDDQRNGGDQTSQLTTIKNNSELYRTLIFKKVKKITATYIISLICCCFYFGSFLLSNYMFQSFENGFLTVNSFYMRIPCLTNVLFSIQNDYLQNKMIINNYTGQFITQEALDYCTQTENQIRITSKQDLLFSLQDDFQNLDSNQFCSYSIAYNVTDQNCSQYLQGFFNLGMTQMIQSILKEINQRVINLNQTLQTNKNQSPSQSFMEQQFFQKTMLNYVMAYFFILDNSLKNIRDNVSGLLLVQVNQMFNYLILLFIAFIMIQVCILLVALQIVIKRINLAMIQTQFQLKLIPGNEYIRVKAALLNDKKIIPKQNANN